jgi:hypothetical protein
VTLRDGYNCLRLIEAESRSARTGQPAALSGTD